MSLNLCYDASRCEIKINMQTDASHGGGEGGQTGAGPAPDLSPAPHPSSDSLAGSSTQVPPRPEQLQELKGCGEAAAIPLSCVGWGCRGGRQRGHPSFCNK